MKRIWTGAAALIGVMLLAYSISRARATGVPTTGTLSYTGTMLTFGQPDNSTHMVSVALWPNGATSAACASNAASIQFVNGQFSVPLPPQCVTAVHQNPNVQVQVTVDSTPMGLTSIAAVPYALEAGSLSATPMLSNVGLTAAIASSALTITLTQNDGMSAPTASNPAIISFRAASATSGAVTSIEATTTLSITVPFGASLGQFAGAAEHTYVYAQDYAGSIQLCVSTGGFFDEGSLQTSLAIAASATSRTALYCMAAATGPIRLLGRILATEATAGSWTSGPMEVTVAPFVYENVTAPTGTQMRVEIGLVAQTSSNCSVTSADGAFASCTRNTTGEATINYATGAFSGTPICTCSTNDWSCAVVGWSGTGVTVVDFLSDTGAWQDGFTMQVMCLGAR